MSFLYTDLTCKGGTYDVGHGAKRRLRGVGGKLLLALEDVDRVELEGDVELLEHGRDAERAGRDGEAVELDGHLDQ